MTNQRDPLDRLREAVRWFVGVPELRLLHVHVSSELRLGALIEIARGEERPYNTRLFVLSDVAAEKGPADWDERTKQIDELMADRRTQAAERGVNIAEPVRGRRTAGLEGFAVALRSHIDALPPSIAGLIVVLAPWPLVDAVGWATDLRLLLQAPMLHRARYIVVEPDPAPGRALAQELGAQAELVDVQPGSAANRNLLALRLAGMKSAPKGADPARLLGMAGPREAPPPRHNAPAPDPQKNASELEAAGAPAGLANPEAMQALRIELTSVALAQEMGDTNAALEHETQARDAALGAGLTEQAAILDLMLGAQMMQGGSSSAALRQFERVIKNSGNTGQPKIEAQAHMAKAATLLGEKRPHEASQAYLAGAAAAEKADSKPLVIECYRMLGQIWLDQGNPVEAGTAFGRAVAVANKGTEEEAVGSSAPQAARQLAAIYRSQGLAQHAQSLEAQADQWEANARAKAEAIEAGEPAQPASPDGSGGSGSTPPPGGGGS
jgi:tetratricopeptide (TPR) repeat protein